MKTLTTIFGILLSIAIFAQVPQKLSYQGKLIEDETPVTGSVQFEFQIVDGSSILWSANKYIDVQDGLYSTTLGEDTPIPNSIFGNEGLELVVIVNGEELAPNTPLLSVPYAIKAETAKPEGYAGGDLFDTYPNPTVTGLQGYSVSSATPSSDDALIFNGSQWAPGTVTTTPTGPACGDLSGTYPCPTVAGIQNNPVSSGSPSSGEVLKWNGSEWIPDTDLTGGGAPTGPAGGDLSGTYPDPTVAKIQNKPVSSSSPSSGEVLKWNGSEWIPDTDLSGGSPTGSAGGDLSGTYPDPTVAKIQNKPVSSSSPSSGEVLKWNGTEWAPQSDATGGLTLPYYCTYSGGGDAFVIEHTGSGGGLAEFEISNSGNSGTVLFLETNGSGEVIDINNYGTGDAIFLSNQSNAGDAIYIKNYGNYNALKAYGYGNNEVLYARQEGTDDCAEIRISNSSNSDDALYATTNGTGRAGYFYGDVFVNGNFSKSGGSFLIDHPLDPENKYLYHSFVESPDMMNVYNGNIVLNNNGKAVVDLPEWFGALNKDYRYQLTCIGGFAPVYIAEKISDNRFKIAGGTVGLEVSWQVTGIRQDPYANDNRIQVEVEKSDKEKGYYLNHKEYNQPIEKSIEAVKNPEIIDNN